MKIFNNPLRANKIVNSQNLSHIKKSVKAHIHVRYNLYTIRIQLFKLEKGNIIGDEDLIHLSPQYTTSVVCSSLNGLVGRMKREDFLRLENQAYAWNQLLKNAKMK